MTVTETDGGYAISNGTVAARISAEGHLVSLKAGEYGRELIAPGTKGALLQLHRDAPNAWDSWDIDEFYHRISRDLDTVGSLNVETESNGTVRITAFYETRTDGVRTVERPYEGAPSNGAGSNIALTYALAPESRGLEIELKLDWHERKKALKLAFPLDLRAAHMASEIQFGHIERPIPVNTLDDFGRFETCAHRWVRIQEGTREADAVALINDSSYGHVARRYLRNDDGGTTTVVRATVIRAAEFPDPRAEEGHYTMRYSLVPGASIAESITEAERLNGAVYEVDAGLIKSNLVSVGPVGETSLRLATVKLAEDRSGDVIVVRLYESEGSRTEATVTIPGAKQIFATDRLERELCPGSVLGHRALSAEDEAIDVVAGPFQIVTLRGSL